VHEFPSLQPLLLLLFVQVLSPSQESLVQPLPSLQPYDVPEHPPPEQVSEWVQLWPSLQPLELLAKVQVLSPSQESLVQPLLSLQV